MKKGPLSPKGFRDIMPLEATVRRKTQNIIADVLEEYGFVPLETPVIEYAQTLTSKYGEDEKLIYKFNDRGGRELALRYDLTVPLARFIANNQGLLQKSKIFMRYQIGQVFRGENTQKGRYREFTQFDFDIVGDIDISHDASVIAAAISSARKLGLSTASMVINDRANFNNVDINVIRAIDKIHKLGKEALRESLVKLFVPGEQLRIFDSVESMKKTENLVRLFDILQSKYGIREGKDFSYDPTLVRGLDYYTGTVFELKPLGKPEELSIGGGGRYDKLIGVFLGKDVPAVGFSFGFDRLIEELIR